VAARSGDPHLRSAHAVTGYTSRRRTATSAQWKTFRGRHAWAIRTLLVDTTMVGRQKVLVAPAWIQRVDWGASKVLVTVTRAQIRPVRVPIRREWTRLRDATA